MLTERLQREEELGIASKWGWVVLRGVVAILFGLLAFSHPGAITLGLVLLFGAYAFISGVAAIVSAARRERAGASWGALLAEGILGVAVAVIAVLWPASAALAFVWVIGAWAIMTGALEIATAVRLRKVIEHEWTLGLAGAISIAFGLLMLFRPVIGGLALVFWLGGYAFVIGILLVVLGFKLRGIQSQLQRGGDLPLTGGTATRST
jgi:uncharacterized membrane protein HdeD (DUF308 family)